MADEKRITEGAAGPTTLPSVAIPETATPDEYGTMTFAIETHAGEVTVECWGCRLARCKGTVDALVLAGFMAAEWAPGLPGNNTTQQTVAFGAAGAQLILGSRKGIQTKEPHITIKRRSRRLLEIDVPFTEEQQARLKAARDRNPNAKPARVPLPLDVAKGVYCNVVERAIAWIGENITDSDCGYTSDSMHRIHAAFEELRRAFADGRVVPLVPKYQRVGNIVCWPGRGAVAPVAPTLLQ